ncbi:PREDICTED: uncharacterized protein LOC109214504 [Nicotiana attenuata]|uniref:uncharacterized protein LOC109214504 n=1 Tax=Nicotiana attenuata TaxID=49451 RepID=UPI000904AAFF|nr:PREDICTED: uncharacterized protein LOC109214504 [Nicotiana attenuata]
MLKQIHLNIPLVDMLRTVPKYAKYIKDIVSNKRKLTKFEIVALTKECISRIQYMLPQKLKDTGAPIPTTVMLQSADRSYVYPEGVLEDVLLQIGKFIFPADFIILDYELMS